MTDRLLFGGGMSTQPGRFESVEIMNNRGKGGQWHLITVWYTKEGDPTPQRTANWIMDRLGNLDTEETLRAQVAELEEKVGQLEDEVAEVTEREDEVMGSLLDLQHGRNRLEGDPE